MDNCWISCQVKADMRKVYDDIIIINLSRTDLRVFSYDLYSFSKN